MRYTRSISMKIQLGGLWADSDERAASYIVMYEQFPLISIDILRDVKGFEEFRLGIQILQQHFQIWNVSWRLDQALPGCGTHLFRLLTLIGDYWKIPSRGEIAASLVAIHPERVNTGAFIVSRARSILRPELYFVGKQLDDEEVKKNGKKESRRWQKKLLTENIMQFSRGRLIKKTAGNDIWNGFKHRNVGLHHCRKMVRKR